jgi:cell division protein ZipA
MDKDSLRLVLIVVGVLIIAGILLFGNPERRRHRHASRRERAEQAREADAADTETTEVIQQELQDLGKLIAGDRGGDRAPEPALPDNTPQPAPPPAGPPPPEPDLIISLYLRARVGRKITGLQLLDATTKAGLRFGAMNIFHRLPKGDERAIFSLANLVSPGHFDPDQWNLFETPGVSLFLSLPGPSGALDAWDAMLATGQRLAELLQADLLDDQQQPVSRQRVAEIRETMREYDRDHSAGDQGD